MAPTAGDNTGITSALAPLEVVVRYEVDRRHVAAGIRVPVHWSPPIVVVRESASRVLAQTEGSAMLADEVEHLVTACGRR
jgi:hypothetical protein